MAGYSYPGRREGIRIIVLQVSKDGSRLQFGFGRILHLHRDNTIRLHMNFPEQFAGRHHDTCGTLIAEEVGEDPVYFRPMAMLVMNIVAFTTWLMPEFDASRMVRMFSRHRSNCFSTVPLIMFSSPSMRLR